METLIVPGKDDWMEFLAGCDTDACSGIRECDVCKKKMYPKRQKYLKSWMSTYVRNKDAIKSGKVKIEPLHWVAAETAKEFTLGEFHRQYCSSNLLVNECECDISTLLKTMHYGNIYNERIAFSLDIIYGVYMKMNK